VEMLEGADGERRLGEVGRRTFIDILAMLQWFVR
jgi:hypothetical protein